MQFGNSAASLDSDRERASRSREVFGSIFRVGATKGTSHSGQLTDVRLCGGLQVRRLRSIRRGSFHSVLDMAFLLFCFSAQLAH